MPKNMSPSQMLGGLVQAACDVFKDRDKVTKDPGVSNNSGGVDPGYPYNQSEQDRIKFMVARYYREAAFEKIQFSRKWMRNALMFQGYHELEWSEINVAWEALTKDSGDYAFPN